jgi:hypothetical protein
MIELKEIIPHASNYVLLNGKPFHTVNGAYYHYGNVVSLLNGFNEAQNKELLPDLKYILEALQWMWSNMAVVNKELQSDAFNIPANAITQLEQIISAINNY